MGSMIKFTKMHGLGNDFVVIDRVTQNFPIDSRLIQSIAERRKGIGCDQVLLVEPPTSPKMDFFYRIFNADGSEALQCGNGARCLARFIHDNGLINKDKIIVGTLSGLLQMSLLENNEISVEMGLPKFKAEEVPILASPISGIRYALQLEGIAQPKECDVLSMGNPHCILSVAKVEEASVASIGAQLQKSPLFPKGVNVSFVQILARNHIVMRVFERGVGETPACGTAACAAVVAGILNGTLSNEVKVSLTEGSLTIRWKDQKSPVTLIGPASSVYQGQFLIKNKPLS